MENRRRAERHPCDQAGRLHLSGGRQVDVRVKNIGILGALCEIENLEEPVLEGERASLEHPELAGEAPGPDDGPRTHTAGVVVRVELELAPEGILRHVAVWFDGGGSPA